MQATIVFVVGLGESAAALRRLAGDVEETVKRLAEPGATAPIVPPRTTLRNEVALSPREAFLGAAEQLAVDAAIGRISSRVDRELPARRAGAAAGRADLRRDRRLPARAGAERRAAARRERPAVRDDQRPLRGSMIDPLERWAQYGEKPDYAGPADLRRNRLLGGPGRPGRIRRGDRRRADGRPRLRPPGRAHGAARDPLGELPARAAPGGQGRRVRRAARARLRRRGRAPGRPGALARRDRGDGRRRSSPRARSRSCSAATTR